MREEQPLDVKARRVLKEEGWGRLMIKGARFLRRATVAAVRKPLLAGGFYLPGLSLSHYVALHEFATSLESLVEKRRWLQAHRVRSDEELAPLFYDPLRPTWNDPAYVRFYHRLTRTMGIGPRFTAGR
jgi:hypothetical protein